SERSCACSMERMISLMVVSSFLIDVHAWQFGTCSGPSVDTRVIITQLLVKEQGFFYFFPGRITAFLLFFNEMIWEKRCKGKNNMVICLSVLFDDTGHKEAELWLDTEGYPWLIA
ncbi:MAG: hypothetical protein IKI84_13665, partial [Clostridia bacterium]|nr:hypothetical protein [Clostridia bacterium]